MENTAKTGERTSLRNVGKTFRRVDLPKGWSMTEDEQWRDNGGYRFLAKHPKTKDTTISVSSNHQTLSTDDARRLNEVISQPPKLIYDSSWENKPEYTHDSNRKDSIRKQVLALNGALGRSQLGDNQFSHVDPMSATFVIDRLETKMVNGKEVLSLNGYFPVDGKPSRFLEGIIVPLEVGGQTDVHRVILQGTDRIEFGANMSNYNKVLKSIDWN